MGEIFAELEIDQSQMQEVEKSYRISRNEFFITIAALAISIYNRRNDIKISWNYNGRESMEYMTTVGLLFRELPVGIRFRPERTIRDVFSDVQDQVRKGIEHCCYPYVDIHGEVATGESAYLLYQQDLRDTDSLEEAGMEVVDVRQNQAASQTILDMEVLDGSDGLQLMIDFSASWYDEKSMERFAWIFAGTAQLIAQHDGQTDLTIKEITHSIQMAVVKEVMKAALGEQISDERKKPGKIGGTFPEGRYRHSYDSEQTFDGPDTRRDAGGNILSESLHILPGAGLVKETVRGGGSLLRNFSARFRRKR